MLKFENKKKHPHLLIKTKQTSHTQHEIVNVKLHISPLIIVEYRKQLEAYINETLLTSY